MVSFLRKVFLENRSLKQTVVKNTFWLISAEVVSRLLGLILVIYIARILGATEYGKFTFAFSFVSILAILCDLGLSDISTREFSRDRKNEKKLAGVLGLEVILCISTLIIAFVSSFFITADPAIRKSVWILAIFIISNSFLGIIFSFLRARQRMEYEAVIKILQALLGLAVVILVILNIPSIINLSYGYLLSNVIILIVSFLYFNFYFQKVHLRFKKDIFEILKISWPLSLGLMIGWIYISINSVMLGLFGLITENGWYNAASRIAIVAIIPASLIVKSFYPGLSNFFISSKQNLQKAWDYLMELMIFLAVPTVIGGIALSDNIIKSFYGSDFGPSVFALQLLMIVVGISFVNYPYGVILVVSDHQRRNFGLIVGGSVINILLNIFFIPLFGFCGAIISTIMASFVVFSFSVFFSKKLALILPFNKELAKTVLISFLSSTIMYFVISHRAIHELNIFYIFIIGILTYGLLTFLLYRIVFPKRLIFFKKWINPWFQ